MVDSAVRIHPTKTSDCLSHMAVLAIQSIPAHARLAVIKICAEIIDVANAAGNDRWGLTPYVDAIRVNVGWTEILTASSEGLQLVVVGEGLNDRVLPEGISIETGENERGFYPTVPGSWRVVVPYYPDERLEHAIDVLRPALVEAVRLAARRVAGRGVKAGHSQEATSELETFLGRPLPVLSYATSAFRAETGFSRSEHDFSNTDADVAFELEDKQKLDRAFRAMVAASATISSAARQARLREAPKQARRIRVWAYEFARNPDVVAEVRFRANGRCEGCGTTAPFLRAADGTPYLEVHHREQLSCGGEDTVENAVALCPNCHRKQHYG